MNDEDDGEVFGEREVAIVAVADQSGQHALAEAIRRIRAEITGAADSAIAQIPPISGNTPIGTGICCGHWERRGGGHDDIP